jgi:zinc protease
LGERRLTVHRFAQLPLLMVAYHVPASAHADHVPLQALRNVLVTGQSSRLYQRLVDKGQLAISVEGGADLALDPTLFVIAIQPKEGVALPAVEQALYEELDKVRAEDITPRELEKAKNALLADHYRQLKTISGKAQALGNFEIFFGDYRKLFQVPDEYGKLTLADVHRVAARYFVERNRTVATLLPQKEESAGGKP